MANALYPLFKQALLNKEHNLDTDSRGNLYATETYTGARVQRFVYKGLAPVAKASQGPPWPKR